jgi:hypothetical protein
MARLEPYNLFEAIFVLVRACISSSVLNFFNYSIRGGWLIISNIEGKPTNRMNAIVFWRALFLSKTQKNINELHRIKDSASACFVEYKESYATCTDKV